MLTGFPCGCISVRETETHRLEAEAVSRQQANASTQVFAVGDLQLRSFVYKPRLLPLEDFFRRLARGDFKRALKSARLRYSPSNADDKALGTLLSHGIAPAYVEATNSGTEPLDLSALRLTLAGSSTRLEPIANEALPKAFEDFNPKAAAANVYNTGALVVGCAAALALLAVGIMGGGDPLGGAGVIGELAQDLDGDLFNALSKTTHLDYDGLLWKPGVLAPRQSARGLVFFPAGSADWTDLRLAADWPAR